MPEDFIPAPLSEHLPKTGGSWREQTNNDGYHSEDAISVDTQGIFGDLESAETPVGARKIIVKDALVMNDNGSSSFNSFGSFATGGDSLSNLFAPTSELFGPTTAISSIKSTHSSSGADFIKMNSNSFSGSCWPKEQDVPEEGKLGKLLESAIKKIDEPSITESTSSSLSEEHQNVAAAAAIKTPKQNPRIANRRSRPRSAITTRSEYLLQKKDSQRKTTAARMTNNKLEMDDGFDRVERMSRSYSNNSVCSFEMEMSTSSRSLSSFNERMNRSWSSTGSFDAAMSASSRSFTSDSEGGEQRKKRIGSGRRRKRTTEGGGGAESKKEPEKVGSRRDVVKNDAPATDRTNMEKMGSRRNLSSSSSTRTKKKEGIQENKGPKRMSSRRNVHKRDDINRMSSVRSLKVSDIEGNINSSNRGTTSRTASSKSLKEAGGGASSSSSSRLNSDSLRNLLTKQGSTAKLVGDDSEPNRDIIGRTARRTQRRCGNRRTSGSTSSDATRTRNSGGLTSIKSGDEAPSNFDHHDAPPDIPIDLDSCPESEPKPDNDGELLFGFDSSDEDNFFGSAISGDYVATMSASAHLATSSSGGGWMESLSCNNSNYDGMNISSTHSTTKKQRIKIRKPHLPQPEFKLDNDDQDFSRSLRGTSERHTAHHRRIQRSAATTTASSSNDLLGTTSLRGSTERPHNSSRRSNRRGGGGVLSSRSEHAVKRDRSQTGCASGNCSTNSDDLLLGPTSLHSATERPHHRIRRGVKASATAPPGAMDTLLGSGGNDLLLGSNSFRGSASSISNSNIASASSERGNANGGGRRSRRKPGSIRQKNHQPPS